VLVDDVIRTSWLVAVLSDDVEDVCGRADGLERWLAGMGCRAGGGFPPGVAAGDAAACGGDI